MIRPTRRTNGLEVAIIGMAGRFPGAPDIGEFWKNLAGAVESIRFFSTQELDAQPAAASRLREHPGFVPACGVIDAFDRFDAAFFGIAPREADLMDPQQRLLLECAWHALEHAGYAPGTIASRIGVFAGVGFNGYLSQVAASLEAAGTGNLMTALMGNDKDFAATRIAYKLNLKGPAITVQTACSTSLVAVHMACQDILSGGCDMALAGGAFIAAPYSLGYVYEEGGPQSPDGHCRAFDAGAKGTVRGDGVGLVLLKRLDSALADRDHVLAVIKGSAVNNDGSDKVGYTAPGVAGQSKVIRAAHAVAEVAPCEISYVEAHGTGTLLGDPIEIAALTDVFTACASGSCALGSLKTNIGHLDTAAGVAGLIKTTLALQHRMIPASLHFERPNPGIDFVNGPFFVNTRLRSWDAGDEPLRAGVSSFGFGGTNAHVVLEEAPARDTSSRARPWEVVVVSTRNSETLESATTRLVTCLRESDDTLLGDIAYTSHVGRVALQERRAVVAKSAASAASDLAHLAGERVCTLTAGKDDCGVVFMFPGQGAQYAGMGAELYAVEPDFRAAVDDCAERLAPYLGCDIRTVLFATDDRDPATAQLLDQTQYTQPALFVIEYALARLWMQWGIRPAAMIGHSIGEWVAACLAGVMSLDAALSVVACRARLMQAQPGGSMMSVALDPHEMVALQFASLEVAAVNAPGMCTVAGASTDVDELEKKLAVTGVTTRRLRTSHAFHSAAMEPAVEPLGAAVAAISLQAPSVPFISNVTGDWISAAQSTDARYWAKQMREPVLFSRGLAAVMKVGAILLEVGPGGTLSALARAAVAANRSAVVSSASMKRRAEALTLTTALANLWCSGKAVDWIAYHAHERRNRVPLPTYPFQKHRHWLPVAPQPSTPSLLENRQGRRALSEWFHEPIWKQATRNACGDTTARYDSGRVVVFSDNAYLGDTLIERLRRTGQQVVQVVAGKQFVKLGDDDYVIDPSRPGDYVSLLDSLAVDDCPLQMIFHLFAAARQQAEELTVASVDLTALVSLFHFTQALGGHAYAHDANAKKVVEILCVTNRAQCVSGDDQRDIVGAALAGPCRVIAQELVNVRCRTVDVALADSPARSDVEQIVTNLVREARLRGDGDTIAYRGARRWVREFAPVPLHAATAATTRLKRGGVYLITGGAGGIGLEIAAWLAEHYQAKLILTGRSLPPPRELWDVWIATHDTGDPWHRRLLRLQQIESLGGECLVLQADVADEAAMREVLAAGRRRFDRGVQGVIHAAGLASGHLIQHQQRDLDRDVLAPKIAGTMVLATVLRDEPLDFLLLCSSLRSIAGGAGNFEYAAANNFLDAFARWQQASRRLVVSVLWDGWRMTGMGAGRISGEEVPAMEVPEALEVLDRVLCHSLPEVIVSTHDLQTRLARQSRKETVSALAAIPPAASSKTAHSRPDLANEYVAPVTDVECALTQIWQSLLGLDRVGVTDNFFELGGDSVISIQVLSKANQAGLKFSPRDVFDAQTIGELARKAVGRDVARTEQSPLGGDAPLAPIQHWFLAQPTCRSRQWIQTRTLMVAADLTQIDLQRALLHLASHHDMLRASFQQKAGEWRFDIAAAIQPAVEEILLEDAAHTGQLAVVAAIDAACATIDFERGAMASAVLMRVPHAKSCQLVLCIHHLCVDVLSWRILLEDFATLCGEMTRGESLALPRATTSYARWTAKLNDYAASSAALAEMDYWRRLPWTQIANLPLDPTQGNNSVASARCVTVRLDRQIMVKLLEQVAKQWGLQLDSILVAALGRTLAIWSGATAARIDVEGHGRQVLFDDIDVSRTVGWFTTIYPVVLSFSPPATPKQRQWPDAARTQMQQVSKRGANYGVLRYLAPKRDRDLRSLPPAQVSFLYLGQHARPAGGQVDEVAALLASPDPQGIRPFLLEVEALLEDGCLRIDWTFSENLHRESTIQMLSERLRYALLGILEQRHSNDAEALVDVSEAGVTGAQLEAVFEALDERDQ